MEVTGIALLETARDQVLGQIQLVMERLPKEVGRPKR